MAISQSGRVIRCTRFVRRTDGLLCGWRICSELHLPELAAWSGDDRPPDIVIRIGPVPDRLDNLAVGSSPLQIDRQGNCLLTIENIAAYFVKSTGDEVIVSPDPDAVDTEIRVFLLGSVLGLLCHQRRLFPLHASCVAIEGKAIALCGPTGAGKSTTAVQLVRRGHRMVADDVCVIDARVAECPRVLPAFPRLKLSQEALAAAKISNEKLEQDRLGRQSKYHYILSQDFSTAMLPLCGIFLLQSARPDEPEGCVQLSRPIDKIATLGEQVFRPLEGAMLGRTSSLFAAQVAIAGSTPIWRLTRPFDFSEIDRWLGQIEALSDSLCTSRCSHRPCDVQ